HLGLALAPAFFAFPALSDVFLPIRHPPTSTLFPYTTLFRSIWRDRGVRRVRPLARGTLSGRHQPGVCRDEVGRRSRQRDRRRRPDRKSTRLNSSHEWISYAVFCLKKKRT